LFLLAAKSLVKLSASGFLVATASYVADTGSKGQGRALPLEPFFAIETRTGAVAALKSLGFGRTAAYDALSADGRFASWLQVAPDGIITWKGCNNTAYGKVKSNGIFRLFRVKYGEIQWFS
jgi:hypothetical protein